MLCSTVRVPLPWWMNAGVEVALGGAAVLRDLGHDNSMHAISYLPPFV